MPYPVSDPRSFGSVAKIPIRSLPRAALLQLCDAASRTPARQHRRLCDVVGLDAEAFGSVPFGSIRELGAGIFQTRATSGTVSTAGVHNRIGPLEELGLIRVRWERRGTALAGVVYVSRDALEDARPGRRGSGRDAWAAWREEGVAAQLDLAGDEPADPTIALEGQIGEEAGETGTDQGLIDHGLITDPYSDRSEEEDRGASQSPQQRGVVAYHGERRIDNAGEPAPGRVRWTWITPETAGPPPDEDDPIGRLLALCEQHAVDRDSLRTENARRWLGRIVAAHGAEAIVEALGGRAADAEPLRHPLAWLGTVLASASRTPAEAAALRCIPHRRGSAPPTLSPAERDALAQLVEAHGEAAVLAVLARPRFLRCEAPVAAVVGLFAKAAEAGAAADAVLAGEGKPRRERGVSAAERAAKRAWARVGAHAPVEATEPSAPAGPVADPVAAAAWAKRAKPARIGGEDAARLVAVALAAGGVVEVTTGDAFVDLWLATEGADELAALGARVAGAAPVPRPAAPPPWDAAPPVPRPPPDPPRDAAASRMAALAAAVGAVREAA